MAENEVERIEPEVEETEEQVEPHGDTEPETDAIDWKAQSRKHERRAKEYRAEVDRLKAEDTQSAAKIAQLEEELRKAEDEAAGLRAEKERKEAVEKVAKATGVDASVLRGDTEEELLAHAEQIKALTGGYPVIKDGGKPGKAPKDARASFDKFMKENF